MCGNIKISFVSENNSDVYNYRPGNQHISQKGTNLKMIFRTSQGGICDRSLEGSGKNSYLDGGFKDFLFSPLLGEDSHFD